MSKYFQYTVTTSVMRLCQKYSETLDDRESVAKQEVMALADVIAKIRPSEDNWGEYVSAIKQKLRETATSSSSSERVQTVCGYAQRLVEQLDKEFEGRLLKELKSENADKFTVGFGVPSYHEFIQLIIDYRVPKLINELVEGTPLTNNHGRKWTELKLAAKDWHELKGNRSLDAETAQRLVKSRLDRLKKDVQRIQNEEDKATETPEHRQKDLSSYAGSFFKRSTWTGTFNAARTFAAKATGGMVSDGKGELLRALEPFVDRFDVDKPFTHAPYAAK